MRYRDINAERLQSDGKSIPNKMTRLILLDNIEQQLPKTLLHTRPKSIRFQVRKFCILALSSIYFNVPVLGLPKDLQVKEPYVLLHT